MSNKPNRLPKTTTKTSQPRDPGTPLTGVEKLAILNRYVFPVVSIFGPMLLAWLMKWDILIPMGIGCYIFGAYQLIGYKNRWDRYSKFDATALPIAFVILGTFALLFGTNGT